MIMADLKDDLLNVMKDRFNSEIKNFGDKLLSMSPYELQTAFNSEFSAQQWKEFRLHPLVDAWFEEEMSIMVRNKAFKLLNQSGTNNSTATTQALGQMMNYLERKKEQASEPIVFIYSFVPLSEMEEQAPNVRTLENIPTEIKNAIVKIRED